MAETAPTSAPAPAAPETQAPPAAPEAPETPEQREDAAMDAAYSTLADADKPAELAEEPQAPEPEPQTLPDADVNLLSRFHLRPGDLAQLNPDARASLLHSLRERQAADDRVGPELAELRRKLAEQPATQQPPQPAPAQPPQAPQTPAAFFDEATAKELDEWGGEGTSDRLGKALAGPLNSAREAQLLATQMAEQVKLSLELLAQQHQSLGFEAAQKSMPEGVDLSAPEAKQKVLDKAMSLLRAKAAEQGFSLTSYNLAQAIPEAALLLYSQDIRTAEQKRAQDKRRAAIRGTPDSGGRNPGVGPRASEEEREDAAWEALSKGANLDAARTAYLGR